MRGLCLLVTVRTLLGRSRPTLPTAARVLGAIAGADPADPATRDADAHVADYLAALKPDALKGARIGVLRFATGWSAATDKVFEQALAVLEGAGSDAGRASPSSKTGSKMGEAETLVLHTELKVDLNAYLATTPPGGEDAHARRRHRVRRSACRSRARALRAGNVREGARRPRDSSDPAYPTARATSLRIAGRDGIDAMLATNHLDALVSPTMPPAWKIDAANGDQISGAGARRTGRRSQGYPHLTVPMGAVMGLPVGLSDHRSSVERSRGCSATDMRMRKRPRQS